MKKRPPVVQARALETRARILAQAERAFAERGFDAASLTSHILDPAEVSVGSFYHQFGNKRDVLFAVLDERFSARRASIARRVLDPTFATFRDVVGEALVAFMDDIEQRPDAWRIQYRERQNPDPEIGGAIRVGWDSWADTARRILGQWYDAEPDAIDDAARLVVMLISGMLRDYLLAEPDARRELRTRIGGAAADFCVAGVERVLTG